jgi:predicted nuclease of predicted toxin-antitoxin system
LKVLLDTCLSPLVKTHLKSAGHDVISAADWDEDPGDAAILARAQQEDRVLVTLDKDFGELGVLRQAPHCGIVRLVNFRAARQGPLLVEILSRHGEELAQGAILTAEPGRIRIRPRSGN